MLSVTPVLELIVKMPTTLVVVPKVILLVAVLPDASTNNLLKVRPVGSV